MPRQAAKPPSRFIAVQPLIMRDQPSDLQIGPWRERDQRVDADLGDAVGRWLDRMRSKAALILAWTSSPGT